MKLPISIEMGEFKARRRFAGEEVLGLLETLRILETAGSDPRIDGVLLDFRGGVPGFGHALTLRRAVDAARSEGLCVVAWADSLDAEDYLLASGCDRVFLPESGGLNLVGLQIEQYFLRELLEHASVEVEVVHIGRYKSAGEMVTRSSMSPEQREQLEAWQADLFDALVGGIAAGRGLEPGEVASLIDKGPYSAQAAREAGLIDATLYRDEIDVAIEPLLPMPASDRSGPRRARWIDARSYYALHVDGGGWHPLLREVPRVAYVAADGSIHRGAGRRGVGSDAFVDLFDELRERSEVRAVVLRIDSPGGMPSPPICCIAASIACGARSQS